MKAKFSLLFFVTTLLLPFWGNWGIYKLEQTWHRKSVKRTFLASLPEKSLTRISVHIDDEFSELAWEHDREFKWRGNMYDIVHRQSIGDSLVFWCWLDSKENALNKRLENLLSRNKQINQNESALMLNLDGLKLQLVGAIAFEITRSWKLTINILGFLPVIYQSPNLFGFSPPPEV